MVELYLLAIEWGASFVEGINFTIMTIHKALIPIFRDYSHAEIENKHLHCLQ